MQDDIDIFLCNRSDDDLELIFKRANELLNKREEKRRKMALEQIRSLAIEAGLQVWQVSEYLKANPKRDTINPAT